MTAGPSRTAGEPGVGEGRTRAQGGFLLPLVLLALLAVGALVSAALVAVESGLERTLLRRGSVSAASVAESGMARYLAGGSFPGRALTFVSGPDTAAVELTALLELDSLHADSLYLLTSTGLRRVKGQGVVRRIGILLTDLADRLDAGFAMATTGTVDLQGDAVLDGTDRCGERDGAGLILPEGGRLSGEAAGVAGSPPVDSSRVDGASVLEATGVDWAGVRGWTADRVDHAVPPDPWPDFSGLGTGEYPRILVADADLTLGGAQSGRGTIVATGGLQLEEGFQWEGLILVAGGVEATGRVRVTGGIVAGFGSGGEASPPASRFVGTSGGEPLIRYDSCLVRRAASRAFRRLARIPGSWAEELAF